MKLWKKVLSLGIACSLVASMTTGCAGTYEDADNTGGTGNTPVTKAGNPGLSSLTVDANTGEMQITRPDHSSETSMGADGTWTIFVYLCGSDLESDGGMGTGDLEEMCNATADPNVKFVVETGGSNDWNNGAVDSNARQRFLVENNDLTEVYNSEAVNMGDTAALTDFLRWGVQEYPAQHMGLVFWDHGSGSISGVCFDELHEQDGLTLSEINSALYSVSENMTDRFEFIGFDACLMGTVETANALAPYSRYMVGSEESEPGSGWDYTAIGDYLASNPNANGAELGTTICDSFLQACENAGDSEITTLAVIDLEALDNFLVAYNTFANSLYTAGNDADILANLVRGIESAENFGGNDKSEGYTNMVDIGAIINACSDNTTGGAEALAALEQTVIYKVSGSMHTDACGLSTYYPLCIQGSNELEIFESVCVSPYYMSFVDRQAYGSGCASGVCGDQEYSDEEYDEEDYEEDYEDDEEYYEEEGEDDSWWYDDDEWYDDSYWYDEDDTWTNCEEYEYDDSCDCYRSVKKETNHYDYVDQIEPTGESRLIEFKEKPTLTDEGVYTFTLSERGIQNAAAVSASLYQLSEDGNTFFELGETYDVTGDWNTGVFEDMFDGYWMSLPDGQNLALYIADYDDSSVIYTTPILLNGEETNLRIKQTNDGTITVEGAWDGIDENGAAAREIKKIKAGDTIAPMYYYFNLDDEDTSDDEMTQGETYTVEGDLEIAYGLLASADYSYSFCIDDIYGDYYLTEFVEYAVDEDGTTYFYVEE